MLGAPTRWDRCGRSVPFDVDANCRPRNQREYSGVEIDPFVGSEEHLTEIPRETAPVCSWGPRSAQPHARAAQLLTPYCNAAGR